MNLKNSFKLMVANAKTVFADMIFRLIIFVLCAGVASTFVIPFVKDIVFADATRTLFDELRGVIGAFFTNSAEMAVKGDLLLDAVKGFNDMLADKISDITGVAIGLAVILVVYSILFGLANYASGDVVNKYMSSLTRCRYTNAILSNFGKAFLYQLIEGLCFFVAETLIIAFCFGVFVLTAEYIYIFAPMLAILLVILLNTFFTVFFSNFLPAITAGGQGVFSGFKTSFVYGAKHFKTLFAQYLIVNLILIYVNVSFTLFTFGVGFIFSLPVSCVFVSCVKLVNYYSFSGKKYYVDYDDIVNPAKQNGEEIFFDDVNI